MASPDPARTFADARLHIVTGKGGVGKTTVAAALALALASQGKRVLLAEVEGRQGISQTFGISPLGIEEVRVVQDSSGGELWGLSVEAKAALMEYLQTFYKLGRAGSALEKVGAIDFATTIAPGVRDVLLIGKVYESAGRTVGPKRHQGALVYDAVVLDAPPTGRAVRFLNVNAEVASMARGGPIHAQAASITRMLRDPRTVVHMVTLLEEMPVQESIDALAELGGVGLNMGAFVVNQVREPLLSKAQLAAVTADDGSGPTSARVRADLVSVGVKVTGPMVAGLLEEGRAHCARVALEREMADEIAAQGLPVLRLPALAEGVEDGGVAVLADELAEQGVR